MNLQYLFLAILFFCNASTTLASGGMEGGGGQGVVCRDKAGKIQSAELYDLFEGRLRYGLKISSENMIGNFIDRAIFAHRKIASIQDGSQDAAIKKSVSQFFDHVQFVPVGTILKPIEDAEEVILPQKPCYVEQVANYTSAGELLISKEIWKAFDETSRAALIIHEQIYYILRMGGEKTSTRSRLAVAQAFAGINFGKKDQDVPTSHFECETDFGSSDEPIFDVQRLVRFWAYENQAHELTFQFTSIFGQPALGTTRIVFYDRRLNDLKSQNCWWQSPLTLQAPTYRGVSLDFQNACGSPAKTTISWYSLSPTQKPVKLICREHGG